MPQVGLEYVDKQLKHGQIGLLGQIGLGPPYRFFRKRPSIQLNYNNIIYLLSSGF